MAALVTKTGHPQPAITTKPHKKLAALLNSLGTGYRKGTMAGPTFMEI